MDVRIARGRSRSDRGPKNQQVGGSRTQSCNMSYLNGSQVEPITLLASLIPWPSVEISSGADRLGMCPLENTRLT